MKKLTRVLFILLSVVVAAFALVGCSDPGAPAHKIADSSTYTISVESVEQKLDEFMSSGRFDRTRYTSAEADAAEYLARELAKYGYVKPAAPQEPDEPEEPEELEEPEEPEPDAGWETLVQPFDIKSDDRVLTSQNIVAVYEPEGIPESHKNVVIGAYYDNCYDAPYEGDGTGTRSHGALSNGTGVATLLAIAEHLQIEKPVLEYSVTIVFFGASALRSLGASEFYSGMTAQEKTNTVLMIELQRLGVDHVYAYCDSRETKREKFFDGIAKENGLDIYKVTQKSPAITSFSALNGIPYYQWAMNGDFAVFFNHNIPTLNLIGANWETIDLTDAESAKNDSVELTEKDTLANLKKLYPDYGKKMAAAATLVVEGLKAADFIDTMSYDRDHFPDTDVLTKGWVWNLVVLGIAAVAGAVMMFVTYRLTKKYPIVAPTPRKMKMAVFGMDYEDQKDDEIYIDVKQPDEEIFPGVPNNDPAVDFDDPFSLITSILRGGPSHVGTSEQSGDTAKNEETEEEIEIDTHEVETIEQENDREETDEKPTEEQTTEEPKQEKEAEEKKHAQATAAKSNIEVVKRSGVKSASKSGTAAKKPSTKKPIKSTAKKDAENDKTAEKEKTDVKENDKPSDE
ncbi:MAG: M28 family peptidase [Clostridiales bacterium]|nr:M28 family peptidase [Clostridiales bacterium]